MLTTEKNAIKKQLNMGSRVVKEARLKILCVMLPGFKSLPMYLIIKIYYLKQLKEIIYIHIGVVS